MKLILLCIATFFSTSVFAQVDLDTYFDSIIHSNIGMQYPPSVFTTIEGSVISTKECTGKVTFINFWFETWSPCIAEFDALNALYNRFKSNPKFQFISLCRDTPEEVKESVKRYKLPYPVCSLPHDECYRLNCGLGFPTTIIIDQTGKITFIKSGGSINKIIAAQDMIKIEEKIMLLLDKKNNN